ncbi:hypothetical protein TNCV_2080611 [Trichonephila clavipes]|nr:hypothetical protein TNCV_2080611 [Trichonephila clavipes]
MRESGETRFSNLIDFFSFTETQTESVPEPDGFCKVIEEVIDFARQINLEVKSYDVQELLDSNNIELTIDELIQMLEQEQHIEELVHSEDRMKKYRKEHYRWRLTSLKTFFKDAILVPSIDPHATIFRIIECCSSLLSFTNAYDCLNSDAVFGTPSPPILTTIYTEEPKHYENLLNNMFHHFLPAK